MKKDPRCSECGRLVSGGESKNIICSKCVAISVAGVVSLEEKLRTNFIDTADYNEKVFYYDNKVQEAEKRGKDTTAIKTRNMGYRLRSVRNKLKIQKRDLANYCKIHISIISQYEKGRTRIPEHIKEWVKDSESTFRNIGVRLGKIEVIKTLLALTGVESENVA